MAALESFPTFEDFSNTVSAETIGPLRRAFYHLESVTLMTDKEILNIRGIGEKRFTFIIGVLGQHSLSLLESKDQFVERFHALYGLQPPLDTPAEAIETTVRERVASFHDDDVSTRFDHNLFDVAIHMRKTPESKLALFAATLGQRPVEGPLGWNDTFLYSAMGTNPDRMYLDMDIDEEIPYISFDEFSERGYYE